MNINFLLLIGVGGLELVIVLSFLGFVIFFLARPIFKKLLSNSSRERIIIVSFLTAIIGAPLTLALVILLLMVINT